MTAKNKLSSYFKDTVEHWRGQRAPYVWPMMLSLRFFTEAERLLLKALDEEELASFMSDTEFAPISLIMLGEWYKRGYTGVSDDTPQWVREIDWRRAWENSGVRNWKRWVYSFTQSGNQSWLYSGMVLGGLACVFEHSHDRSNRLLRDLCRLFHGEEDLQLDASARAQALRASIEQQGSVYRYIMEMTDAHSELSVAFSTDEQEEVRNLRNTILRINREVIQGKLNSEWIITTSPYQQDTISKSLRVKLRPERVDGEKRWFLSRERAEEWGFRIHGDLTEITLSARFYLEGSALPDDIEVLHFQTAGKASAGFNTIEPEHMGVIDRMPQQFDAWRLVARANDGQEVEIDATLNKVGEYEQIYQTASNPRQWGSNHRRRPTVVIFSDNCTVTDPQNHPVASKRMLVDYQPNGSVNWAEIPAYVILRYPEGDDEREVRLVSPLAGCKVVVPLFTNLISYQPGGLITVTRTDAETGEEIERLMPLLFGLKGLQLSWKEDKRDPELIEPTHVLLRQNGMEVNPDEACEGVVEVTVFARGMSASTEVWYMPDNGSAAPLVRDLDKQRIVWADGRKEKAVAVNHEKQAPATVHYTRSSKYHDKAHFDVYLPVRLHEVYMRNALIQSVSSTETLELALLNLMEINVRIFDEDGFAEWRGTDHMEPLRRLAINQPNYVELRRGNIRVHNILANKKPDMSAVSKYGNISMQTDRGRNLLEYPQVLADKPKGPFGGKSKGITATEALKAAIEDNLYSFMFQSVRDLKGEIMPTLSDLLKNKDTEYLKEHAPVIKRILWENGKTVKDLVKIGIKL